MRPPRPPDHRPRRYRRPALPLQGLPHRRHRQAGPLHRAAQFWLSAVRERRAHAVLSQRPDRPQAVCLQACTGPVAFEMDCAHRLTAGPTACQYGYDYQSLLGTGQVRILKDPAEKAAALSLLMRAQTGRDFSFSESETCSVAVFSLTSTDYTAKQRGY